MTYACLWNPAWRNDPAPVAALSPALLTCTPRVAERVVWSSPDGRRVAVSASTSNTVHVLDISTGRQLGSFQAGDKPHENIFTDGGRYLWKGAHNYVELSPHTLPAHVFRVLRRTHPGFENFA